MNSLFAFHNRYPMEKDYIESRFKAIECMDKYSTRQQWDTVHLRYLNGVPFKDYQLVLDMSQKLSVYLTHFGYDLFPTGNYSTSESDESDLDYASALNSIDYSATNCEALNSSIGFANPSAAQSDAPPLLISFPGMSNSWIRKLIEMATGVYTGSLGELDGSVDPALSELFVGEKYCGRRFSVINCGTPNVIHSNTKYTIGLDIKPHRTKCRQGVVHEFRRSVLFVRNPYDAIVEAYLSETEVTDSVAMDDSWTHFAKDTIVEYTKMWESTLQYLSKAPREQVFLIRYEDIQNDDESRRVVLRKLLKFLGVVTNDEKEFKEQTMREYCLRSYYSALNDLPSFKNVEFESFPYENPEMINEINSTLWMYFDAFGYRAVPSPVLHTGLRPTAVDYLAGVAKANVSLTQCMQRHDAVQFAPLQTSAAPPLLLSMPGSGSIWFRKLIEQTTGWLTGSLGQVDGSVDPLLDQLFGGEKYCGRRFAAINCPDPTLVSTNEKLSLALHVKAYRAKCRKGVIHEFTRSIVLVRNPFDAIVSAYRDSFFHEGSLDPSIVGDSGQIVLPMNQHWIDFAIEAAESYPIVWKESFATLVSGQYAGKTLVVKYEDLLDQDSRVAVLGNLSIFLGSFGDGMNAEEQRIKELCSVLMDSFNTNYHDINTMQFGDVPYDSTLVHALAGSLESYISAFDYDTMPSESVFGERKTPTALSDTLHGTDPSINTGQPGSQAVLNMTYSRPLSSYSPALLLNGNASSLQATLRCSQNFGYRRFWTQPRNTPLLLSFAGSGKCGEQTCRRINVLCVSFSQVIHGCAC
jgi:hypothetical protein